MKTELNKNLKDLLRMALRGIKEYYYAKIFLHKIKRDIPKNWNILLQYDFNFRTSLLFIHYDHYEDRIENFPQKSYDNLVNSIEKQGVKMKREFVPSLDSGYLDADGYYKEYKLKIRVRQCQIDKCEIEYIEETKKVPILKGLSAELVKENKQ